MKGLRGRSKIWLCRTATRRHFRNRFRGFLKFAVSQRANRHPEVRALARLEGEQRVSLLRSDRVDPDMLDERARYQLDYVNPRDLVKIIKPK